MSPTPAYLPATSSGPRPLRRLRTRHSISSTVRVQFRWRRMWRIVADGLGVEAADYPGHPTPLVEQMAEAAPVWDRIVEAVRSGPQPGRPAGVVVAHQRRPGSHRRDFHRHDQEPAARFQPTSRPPTARSSTSSTASEPSAHHSLRSGERPPVLHALCMGFVRSIARRGGR